MDICLKDKNIILTLDFDSTWTQIETLDELIFLKLNGTDKNNLKDQINVITTQGINNEIDFQESLEKRINILKKLKATKQDVENIVRQSKMMLTQSFLDHKEWICDNKDNIYVISYGFTDIIIPTLQDFHIAKSHIYANTFEYQNDIIINYKKNTFLCKNKRKPQAIHQMKKTRSDYKKIIHVGDGNSDKDSLDANIDLFVRYTEVINRSEKSDFTNKKIRLAKTFSDLFPIIREQSVMKTVTNC